jgi:hypothetical protein
MTEATITLAALTREPQVIARQPIASMQWDWEVPGKEIAAFRLGRYAGRYRTVQRRDASEFVLLAWLP